MGLLGILLLILLHAFFVVGEFGLVAVDRSRIEQLAESGDRRARRTMPALKTLSFQLSGAQLGITITSLLVGFLVEPVLAPLFEPLVGAIGLPEGSIFGISVTVALVLATAVEMVVAELIPKNAAIARPEPTALAISGAMRFANALMKPLIVVFNSTANAAVRLIGIEPRDELTAIPSLEELQVMIRSSKEGGGLEEAEFALLTRSITFAEKDAHDVLTPRVSLVTLPATATLEELSTRALESGHSRFPVQGEDVDDIIGIAHVKDAYRIPRDGRGAALVSEIMRPPFVVPESRDLASLLAEMRRDGQQLAVIVDEYGGTAGIVTLEDILEEIVGEIEDEYDPGEQHASQMASPPTGVHVVPGLMHAPELEETTGFRMPEGDYETLGGFLLTLLDRIPEQGAHVGYEGWEFKVVEMENRRIARVLVVAPPEGDEEEDER